MPVNVSVVQGVHVVPKRCVQHWRCTEVRKAQRCQRQCGGAGNAASACERWKVCSSGLEQASGRETTPPREPNGVRRRCVSNWQQPGDIRHALQQRLSTSTMVLPIQHSRFSSSATQRHYIGGAAALYATAIHGVLHRPIRSRSLAKMTPLSTRLHSRQDAPNARLFVRNMNDDKQVELA